MPARARRGAVWDAGRPGRRSWPRSSRLAPQTAALTGWRLQEPTQDGVVTASLEPGQVVDNLHPGWRSAAAASWSDGAPQPGKAARRCGKDIPATARCRRCGHHGLVARLQPTHRAGGHGPAGAHRSLTVLPGGRACRARSDPVGALKAMVDASCTVEVSISCVSGAAGSGRKDRLSMVRLGPFSSAGGTQRPMRRPGAIHT
jgi:hypothetical protein